MGTALLLGVYKFSTAKIKWGLLFCFVPVAYFLFLAALLFGQANFYFVPLSGLIFIGIAVVINHLSPNTNKIIENTAKVILIILLVAGFSQSWYTIQHQKHQAKWKKMQEITKKIAEEAKAIQKAENYPNLDFFQLRTQHHRKESGWKKGSSGIFLVNLEKKLKAKLSKNVSHREGFVQTGKDKYIFLICVIPPWTDNETGCVSSFNQNRRDRNKNGYKTIKKIYDKYPLRAYSLKEISESTQNPP